MKALFILFLFLPNLAAAKISESLVQAWAKNPRHDILILFEDKVPLEPMQYLSQKSDKIDWLQKELRTQSLQSQARVLNQLQALKIDFKSFYLLNMIAVKKMDLVTAKNLIEQFPEIKKIEKDPLFYQPQTWSKNNSDVSPQLRIAPDYLKSIRAPEAWAMGATGKGITIGGQDSGYAFWHAAIRRQYRGYTPFRTSHDYNWHDAIRERIRPDSSATKSQRLLSQTCELDLDAPCDDTGHGTHTMGSVLGDDLDKNLIGAAPEAKWMGCRNMDAGVGKASTYIECFEFFLAPYPRGTKQEVAGNPEFSPQVLVNSWACPRNEGCLGDEFASVIQKIQEVGIFVVVSAGNDGDSCGSLASPPGSYSDILVSVAAHDHRNNRIAGFSSRGPSKRNPQFGPTISAPGVEIRSSVPSTMRGQESKYESKSGTSMAGPFVAGAVALLWSHQPQLKGQVFATTEILKRSSRFQATSQNCPGFPGSERPNAVFGWGLLDVKSAIDLARQSYSSD